MPICYNISIPSKELKICGKVFLINYNQIVGTKNCNRPLQGAEFFVPLLRILLPYIFDISKERPLLAVRCMYVYVYSLYPQR